MTASDPHAWLKPALQYVAAACNCCAPRPVRVPLKTDPHPGFGSVSLERDGAVWSTYVDPEDSRSFLFFESVAYADPDHDWRVRVEGPLCGVVYQRHGPGEWVAVERIEGFA